MKIALLNFYSGFINRGGETFVHELANRLAVNNAVSVFQAGPSPKNAQYKTNVVGKFKNPGTTSALPVAHTLRRLFLDSHKLRELVFTLQLLPRLIKLRPDIMLPLNSGWQAFKRICNSSSMIVRLVWVPLAPNLKPTLA